VTTVPATAHAVVFGSGPNGLAAAIRLAESGMAVTVFERSTVIGGAVRTEPLTIPGFAHDTCSAVHPAAAASPVLARMQLERHGLRWIHPEVCMAHVLDEGRAITLHRQLDATVESLEDACGGDGRRWRDHVAPLLDQFEHVRDVMLAGFPPVAGALELVRWQRRAAVTRLAAGLASSASRLGASLFRSPSARGWLDGMALHSSAPTMRGSAVAALYLATLGHAVGWPSPEGGAGALAAALVRCLEERGGRVVAGANVVAVRVRRGEVVGVELQDRSLVDCTLVVADVLPRALVELAGDALPARYRRALGAYRTGRATCKVDWALDGPIPWRAEPARLAGTVHVGGTDHELREGAAATARGLPERPFLLLGQQSIADPLRAPAGSHTAWAYMHAPGAALASTAAVSSAVDRIERQVERFAPGFRDRILARCVHGPRQLEALDVNLVDGDVGAGAYDLRQLAFRPLVAASPYRTPVSGLYLASAATFPGGGVHGVCGDAAARCALRDQRGAAAAVSGRLLARAYL
jgi:phytoene dehydrogenase-like protein